MACYRVNCIYLFVCLFIHSINYLCIYWSVYLFICLLVCLFIHSSIYLSVYLFICLLAWLLVYLFKYLFVYLLAILYVKSIRMEISNALKKSTGIMMCHVAIDDPWFRFRHSWPLAKIHWTRPTFTPPFHSSVCHCSDNVTLPGIT
jgi:hypothetical protein